MPRALFPAKPVLAVDDEAQTLHGLYVSLRSSGIGNVVTCRDGREVSAILAGQDVEVMLLDLIMPHVSGEELLRMVVRDFPQIPVIVVTGINEVETAVRCMRLGAFDYMVKPVEKSRLIAGVRHAIEIRELRRENRLLRERVLSGGLESPEVFDGIVTQGEAMHSVFRYVEAIARSAQPVLITGETGTGKELIAKAVHKLSGRTGSFVPVNVAGLQDDLFADTLFGHMRGAFTSADKVRQGLVERASAGTLFLDEIGDLGAASQVKLLRLLQEGEYYPIGSDVVKRSDARIVVATNRDLHDMVEAGNFRKDLYYRLISHHVHLPPLRERMEDLPLLVAHFLEEAAEALHKKRPTPPAELATLLGAYHFPGNIRELQAMISDAVSYHHSGQLSLERFKTHIIQQRGSMPIMAEMLPSEEKSSIVFPERLPTIREVCRLLVKEAMERLKGNQSMAAQILGITRPTLHRYLRMGSSQADETAREKGDTTRRV